MEVFLKMSFLFGWTNTLRFIFALYLEIGLFAGLRKGFFVFHEVLEKGELISLYGNVIWMTQKNPKRDRSCFDQAVHASPSDCMMLGSHAHFIYEFGEKAENQAEIAPAMVTL